MKNIRLLLILLFAFTAKAHVLTATTVVDIVVGSEDHNTLEAAVIAAGLNDDLSAEGPFTLFAPTDDAFAALPEGTLDALLADPSGDLANILLYHVIGSEAMSADLSDGQMAGTLLGKDIEVTINGEGVFINGAKVSVADIEADNGVVHVIDAVLVPPTTTVVDIVVGSEAHETLKAAVIAAGLADDLSAEGPFTIFAPTDDAFAALPEGTLDALLADPSGELANILLYHVVGSKAMSADLSDGQMIGTLLGEDVEVTINGEGVFINGAQVSVADIEADNGVVHVIDAVIVPSSSAPTSINKVNSNVAFDIYPLPASTHLHIAANKNEGQLKVEIIDINGRTLINNQEISGNEIHSIDVSGFKQGYFIIHVSNNKNSISKPFYVIK